MHPMYIGICMKFLILDTHNPHLNLAIEEYLFLHADDEVFMLWQNDKTVVIGKNQNAYAEINKSYTDENGIKIARRITGGGAVYHDLGNVNYTFISRDDERGINFSYFTAPIIEALAAIGVKAVLSGRNDLLADGEKKISGNAQHRAGGRVLHHGTLLFDTDLDVLSSSLKVDPEKIKSKAVKSTRSRVVNIKEILENKITTEEFIKLIAGYVIKKYNPEIISAPENNEVFEIFARNSSAEWIFPAREYVSHYNISKKKRFSFGTVECVMDMTCDTVKDIKISGDFFGTKPVSELENFIKGSRLCDIENALSKTLISDYIFPMTVDELVRLIVE